VDLAGASVTRHSRLLTELHLNFSLHLLRACHLIITLVIWLHYYRIRLAAQEGTVTEGVANYGMKRYLPPFLYALKHVLLLQLLLQPLTMCRTTLAYLGTTRIGKALPLHHIPALHMHFGYFFCFIMVVTLTLFIAMLKVTARPS